MPCVPADVVADTLESFRSALARGGIAIEAHLAASGGTQALIFKILPKKTNWEKTFREFLGFDRRTTSPP